jgi:ATP-dependent Clp protease ATP-binding subunit ClpB
LAHENHPSVLTALEVAVANRKPADVGPILSQSTATLNTRPPRNIWDDELSIFTPHAFDHMVVHGSTPLHYACLLGDMKIIEALLRNGAEWTISDGSNLLPEDYVGVNGDGKMREFKRLCEEETSKRGEEEELRWAGRFAEELELECEEELELECEEELQMANKHEVQKQLEKEEVSNRCDRQRKWFPSSPQPTILMDFYQPHS